MAAAPELRAMKRDAQAPPAATGRSKAQKERAKLYFSAAVPWFEIEAAAADSSSAAAESNAAAASKLTAASVKELQTRAQEIYRSQCAIFQATRHTSPAEKEWFESVVSSGTLTDKASALAIAVQESGVYAQPWLDALLSMAQKHNRREVGASVDNLKDCFMRSLLPAGRKLRYFEQQPEAAKFSTGVCKRAAVLWVWEDAVKHAYLSFLRVVEGLLVDTLIVVRTTALTTVHELLCAKPEQEHSLLTLLLNKLGDGDNKIASKASYLLLLLSQKHPNMVDVVVRETRMNIERSNATGRMRYYALIFLNQIVLRKSAPQTANSLIELYFAVFARMAAVDAQVAQEKKEAPKRPKFVHKKKNASAPPKKSHENAEADAEAEREKLLAAILTGVNRAFPFSDIPADRLDAYVDALFRIVHGANFNASVQALTLLFNMCVGNGSGNGVSPAMARYTDRFYRSFFEVLADPFVVSCTSKQSMLVNLLYKVLKADASETRVRVFFKRLFECATVQQPPFVCAILLLLNQLIRTGKRFLATALLPPAKDAAISTTYDRSKRDPQHAATGELSLREDVRFFTLHFHPSVAKFAGALLEKQTIPAAWIVDPFEKFTVSVFLDKFTYKNPKALSSVAEEAACTTRSDDARASDVVCRPPKGISAMQPLKMHNRKTLVAESVPVNKKYTNATISEHSVPADELFFYKYFACLPSEESQLKAKRAALKASKDASTDDKDEDEGIDDAEIQDFMADEAEACDEGAFISDGEDDAELVFSDEGDSDLEDAEESIEQDFFAAEDEEASADVLPEEPTSKKKKKFKSSQVFADASEYLSD